MTPPDLGPCVCEFKPEIGGGHVCVPHEHSDFPPHACAEPGCGCETWTEWGQNRAQSPADGQTGASVGDRCMLTIPANLDFATVRVRQARVWINMISENTHRFGSPGADPDDPIAVCDLADCIEQSGPEFDPYDVLALLLRLHAAATRPRKHPFARLRRKAQR